jgi:gluconate 2-dehydrogenase gamma chain
MKYQQGSEIDLDRRHFIRGALLAIGAAGAAFPGWSAIEATTRPSARFFDARRFAILDAVAETIMPRTDTPGARDAEVPQRIDLLMTGWASAKTKAEFTKMLDDMDIAAGGIAAMAPDKQLAAVAAYDKAHGTDPAYAKFKKLVLALYYLSEPGATQELAYEHTPGAWEPSIAVTPDTRGYAVDVSFGGN